MKIEFKQPEEGCTRQHQEQGFKRQDSDAYCPRVNQQVLILNSRCFYSGINETCRDCVYDVDHIKVRLMLLLCTILEERG